MSGKYFIFYETRFFCHQQVFSCVESVATRLFPTGVVQVRCADGSARDRRGRSLLKSGVEGDCVAKVAGQVGLVGLLGPTSDP